MSLAQDSSRYSKKYFLCMIMPAKNVEKYIDEAITSYLLHDRDDILLVIIDDHSDDDTFNICSRLQMKNPSRILLEKNKASGKVNAINYGYSLINASYYKFVDADDCLMESFWDMLERNASKNQSFVHPFIAVTHELEKISILPMAHQSIKNNKKYIKNLILLPKVAWTFFESDIENVFPIPQEMPFEDIWFSLSVYANNIYIHNEVEPAYLYRQHESQTFGNLNDISEERLNFRFMRIISSIEIIEKQHAFKDYLSLLDCSKSLANFMMRKESLKVIFFKCGVVSSLKHLLLRDFKKCYQFVRILAWQLRLLQNFLSSKS